MTHSRPAAWPGPLPHRPVLKPLRRAWRGDDILQLGADPERCRLLAGLSPDDAALLALLDGSTDRAGLAAAAARRGLSTSDADRLLAVLDEAGALDDAAVDASPLRGLALADRDRIAPDLAAAGLVRPGRGAAVAVGAARADARVEIRGAGRIGATLAGLLAAAGVGTVAVADPRLARPSDITAGGIGPAEVGRTRADGAVAAYRRHAPRTRRDPSGPAHVVVLADTAPPGDLDALMRDGIAHLPVRILDATAWVGPLVLPGRSACLRCVEAHRRDRDPGWPVVAAQLVAAPPGGDPGVDGALAAVAAAHAALAVLDHLDATALGQDSTWAGRGLVVRLPGGQPSARSWTPHGGCGCRWDADGATMAG